MSEPYEPSQDELAEQHYNDGQAEIQYQQMLEDERMKRAAIVASFKPLDGEFLWLDNHRVNPNFIASVDLQCKRSEGLFGVRIDYALPTNAPWFFPYDSIEAQAICEAFGFEIPEDLKKLVSETRCEKDDIPF